MDPIISFPRSINVMDDGMDAKKLRVKAASYCLTKGVLYQKSFYELYLRCLRPQEVEAIMTEVHNGDLGNHAGDGGAIVFH